MNEHRSKLSAGAARRAIQTPEKRRYELVPLALLKPNPKNTRKHPKRQIAEIRRSYETFGVINPIIVDPEFNILAGHGRYAAAQQLGLDSLPALIVDGLSQARLRAYAITDNRLGDKSSFDTKLLIEEIEAICFDELDFQITDTGFAMGEIDAMLGTIRTAELNDLEDDLPIMDDRVPVSRPGDLWLLDKHRLLCGDSTLPSTIERLVDNAKVQLVLGDTPYNLKIEGVVSGLGKHAHKDFAVASGEMSRSEYVDFLKRSMGAFIAHLINGAIVLLFIDWRHVSEMLEAGAASGFELKNILVWVKDNAGMGSLWRSQHELIAAFKHGTAPNRNNVQLGKNGRHRSNVQHYAGMNSPIGGRDKALSLHPTVKNLALIADLILDVSNIGDIVLDPFGGAGTTLVAAEKTRRTAYLAEISPVFVDVTLERWEALAGRSAVLAASGETYAEVRAARLSTGGSDAEAL